MYPGNQNKLSYKYPVNSKKIYKKNTFWSCFRFLKLLKNPLKISDTASYFLFVNLCKAGYEWISVTDDDK